MHKGFDGGAIFRVVVNHEEQYTIWPADKEVPPGWNDTGRTGTRMEALDHIREMQAAAQRGRDQKEAGR